MQLKLAAASVACSSVLTDSVSVDQPLVPDLTAGMVDPPPHVCGHLRSGLDVQRPPCATQQPTANAQRRPKTAVCHDRSMDGCCEGWCSGGSVHSRSGKKSGNQENMPVEKVSGLICRQEKQSGGVSMLLLELLRR